jgi:NitT/TauT family transport system substrate-binding protein
LGFRKFFIYATFAVPLFVFMSGCHAGKSPDNGLTPLRVQLDWYPQPEHGGFFEAKRRGYYKAAGLDVTLVPLPEYASVAQLVSTGKADIGLGSSDQILEWDSNGLPLIAIAATMQHDPQAVMVHAVSAIHKLKDLGGHTIAAETGATWLKYVIRRYNLHDVHEIPATLSIANFLADPDYVQQVFVTSEPFFAQQAGAKVRTILISSSGYDPYRVQFTTRAFAAQHSDVVRKFVQASIRGWKSYLSDPGPTNGLLMRLNPELNSAQEVYTSKTLADGGFVTGGGANGTEIGQMTAARWNASYEELNSLGILQGPVDLSKAYTLKFLQ